MTEHDKVNLLVDWVQSFDNSLLNNESEVETKFVLPLFKALGYLDNYRRDKYPINGYKTGRPGKKPEADQVYFSTDKRERQNQDTCLIVVETKHPDKALDDALKQAQFYGSYLKPILYVVTNGKWIKVIRRRDFREEEEVFNNEVNFLREQEIANKFYNQFNFCVIRNINESIANVSTHEQYVLLENSLKRHPDLQKILDKGDFPLKKEQKNRSFILAKPKVAISCTLPKGFNEGNCWIEFSNVTLRGLKIHLTHQEILGNLLTGLNTKPAWMSRRFIKSASEEFYDVTLGNTSLSLSNEEASDLCECIDEIFGEYKRIILEDEIILESQDFCYTHITEMRTWGFHLFSVKRRLWRLMYAFANRFAQANEETEWHIFQYNGRAINIRPGISAHALIQPNSNYILSEYVDLLYQIPYESDLDDLEKWKQIPSWRYEVGSKGIWAVTYAKQWLLDKYIPKVISFFKENHTKLYNMDYEFYQSAIWEELVIEHRSKYCNYDYLDDVYDTEESTRKRIPLKEVNNVKQLVLYIEDIQSWFNGNHYNIPSSLIRPYYESLLKLVKTANPPFEMMSKLDSLLENSEVPKIVSLEYIAGNLRTVEPQMREMKWTLEDVLHSLDRQVIRVRNVEYEASRKADFISRSFIAILKDWNINCSQAELNIAKQAVLPLWQESRFEERYIYPSLYPHDV